MTRLSKIATVEQVQNTGAMGREITARFHDDGDVVTVQTKMENAAERLAEGERNKLKNEQQKWFFVNLVNQFQ